MPTPYPVKFKLPLEYLTVQDWNNFVKNLLFLNQYGSAKLLKYYQNGNLQNLNKVIAKYLYVSALKVNGYNVLYNLSQPLAYTFGQGKQQPFLDMSNKPSIELENIILQFPNFEINLPQLYKQIELLIPNKTLKIVAPNQIAGTQFTFSGTVNVQQLIENYLNPQYLQNWNEIIIKNLGNSSIQINNSIYLMPKNCLKITSNSFFGNKSISKTSKIPKKCLELSTNSLSQIQLSAQTSTLLGLEIEFIETITSFTKTTTPTSSINIYTITITNNEPDPTPLQFQQLLQLDLSNILSSPSQLLNLQFCLDVRCNTPLYAWISQYNLDLSNVLIWVLLPNSIPANGSMTIYMFVRNSIQYPYTGINAYYNTEYDNGNYVFDAYINAMGTSYIANNLQIDSDIYSTIQFIPKNGTIPGYILMLNNQQNSYTQIYINFSNANNVNEIFENVQYFNGQGGCQGIGFLGNFDNYNYYFTYICPYYNDSYIYYNGNYESAGTISMFTNSGYNFYQAIVTSSGIKFYGSSISTPIIELPQLNLQLSTSWSSTITPNGSGIIMFDNSYNVTYIGYFYWTRARKLPPNNVMPSNSQPQKTIILA